MSSVTAASLRSKILVSNDIGVETKTIPEWGVTIEIRSMTAKERAYVQMASRDEDGEPDLDKLYALLVIYSVYDPESGERIFGEEDVPALATKNGKVMEEIAGIAMTVSGMNADSVDTAGGNS